MDDPNIFLGIELGSTRIKAVIIDENFRPVSSGEFTWESRLENGLWTYPLDEVWSGLRSALRNLTGIEVVESKAYDRLYKVVFKLRGDKQNFSINVSTVDTVAFFREVFSAEHTK